MHRESSSEICACVTDFICSHIPAPRSASAGTIYSDKLKIAEHGGNSKDDTAVALLVVNPLKAMRSTNTAFTYTTQVMNDHFAKHQSS